MEDNMKAIYQQKVKMENRRKILNLMWHKYPISRSEISRILKMNKSTITNISNELIEEGLITITGSRQEGVGRSFTMLSLDNGFGFAVGVMISTMDVIVAISDLYSNIIWKSTFDIDRDNAQQKLLNRIFALINKGISECGVDEKKILGIGVSVPSGVEHSTGFMYATPSINLYNVPIKEYFNKAFNLPVYVFSNSANAARAEKWFGETAKTKADVACLEISRGVGLGIIISGQVFTGARGFAGSDAAHMVLDPQGPLCACGKPGCWDCLGSIMALGDDPLDVIIERAKSGDRYTIEKMQSMGAYIGYGIANIIKILNPDRVVLSGPIVRTKEWVYESILESVKATVWPHIYNNTVITFSLLKESAPVLGGVMSVIESVIDQIPL